MSEYFNDKTPGILKERLYLPVGVIILAFFLLITRLWYLQVMRGPDFFELSRNNSIRLIKTTAPRGHILDRDGTRLAENRPGFDLFIVPEDVVDWTETKEKLSELVEIDITTIEKRIKRAKKKGRPPFQSVRIKEDLDWHEMVKVESFKFRLPGVFLEVGPKRVYPYKDLFAHLIGYLGEISDSEFTKLNEKDGPRYWLGDMIGKYGIEATLEDTLRGIDGGKEVEVDALGRTIKRTNEIQAIPGNNIYLTIDLDAQLTAMEAMKDKVGAVIAMDPMSGEILALVSSPSFDPNVITTGLTKEKWQEIIGNPLKVLTNRAIQGQYPPASTFKVITAMAALEEKVIDKDTKMAAGASFTYGKDVFRDWNRGGHGNIDIHKAIVRSSDTFFYQVGLKVGVKRIGDYAKLFGMGEKTGINLRGEKRGLVPSKEWKKKTYGKSWYHGETITVAVGQSYLLSTPLQLLNVYATIANGGTLYRPSFIRSVTSPEGKTISKGRATSEQALTISNETLETIKAGLRGVTEEEDGTARYIGKYGLKIAGKTGTAQVVRMKEKIRDITKIPYKLRDHSLFAGYAPYDDPKIAVVVVVEHGGFGSVTAAPIALKVFKSYLEKLKKKEEEKKEKAIEEKLILSMASEAPLSDDR